MRKARLAREAAAGEAEGGIDDCGRKGHLAEAARGNTDRGGAAAAAAVVEAEARQKADGEPAAQVHSWMRRRDRLRSRRQPMQRRKAPSSEWRVEVIRSTGSDPTASLSCVRAVPATSLAMERDTAVDMLMAGQVLDAKTIKDGGTDTSSTHRSTLHTISKSRGQTVRQRSLPSDTVTSTCSKRRRP